MSELPSTEESSTIVIVPEATPLSETPATAGSSTMEKNADSGNSSGNSAPKEEKTHEYQRGDSDIPPPKRKRKSRWDTSVPPPSTQTETPVVMTVDTSIAQQIIVQQVLQQQQQAAATLTPLTAPLLSAQPATPVPDCRIYVGSLNYDLKEEDIKALFASFGTIRSFTMSYDNVTGKSKGYCFVEYETPAMAEAALAMNQFQLAGRPIKVGRPLNAGPSAPSSAPINPMASLLNIPIAGVGASSAPAPATGSAQAFVNGLGAGVGN